MNMTASDLLELMRKVNPELEGLTDREALLSLFVCEECHGWIVPLEIRPKHFGEFVACIFEKLIPSFSEPLTNPTKLQHRHKEVVVPMPTWDDLLIAYPKVEFE